MVQDGVEVHVARSWAIGTASTVRASPASKTCLASRSTPAAVVRSPTPTAIHARCEQQHVAAFDVLVVASVDCGHPANRGCCA